MININWEIFFASLPTLIGFGLLGLLVYGSIYMIIFMILDGFLPYGDNMHNFIKVNIVAILIVVIGFLICFWIDWSNKTLSKPENQNKPIVEFVNK